MAVRAKQTEIAKQAVEAIPVDMVHLQRNGPIQPAVQPARRAAWRQEACFQQATFQFAIAVMRSEHEDITKPLCGCRRDCAPFSMALPGPMRGVKAKLENKPLDPLVIASGDPKLQLPQDGRHRFARRHRFHDLLVRYNASFRTTATHRPSLFASGRKRGHYATARSITRQHPYLQRLEPGEVVKSILGIGGPDFPSPAA